MLKNFIAKMGARHGAEEPAGKPDEPSNDGPPSQLPQQQEQVAQPEQEQQAQHPPASSAASSSSSSASLDAKCSIFFARVPPTITHEQLLAVFGCFGQVAALNLFRPFADAKTSKGCGIVTFDSAAAATAAKEQLHGQFRFNADGPSMVVEGVNESKIRSTVGTPGSSGCLFKPKSQSNASSNRAVRANSNGASSSSSAPASAAADAPAAVAAAARPAAAGAAGQAAGAPPADTSSAALKDQQQQQQGPKPPAAGQAWRWHEQQQQPWQPPPPLPAACHAPMSAGPMQLMPMALQQQQQQPRSMGNMPSGLRPAPTPFSSDASQAAGLSCSSSAGGSNQLPQQMMAAGSGAGAAGSGAGQDLVQAIQACCLAQSNGNSGQLTQLTGDEAYVPTFRPLPGINHAAALQPGGWPRQLLLQQQQQIAAAGAADANGFCSAGLLEQASGGGACRPLAGGLGQPAPLPRQAGLFDVPVPAQQSEQQLLLAAAAAAAGIPSRNAAASVSGGLLLAPGSAYSEHSQSQQRFSQLSAFSVLDTSGPGSALPDFLASQGGLFSGEGHVANNINNNNSGCCLSGGGFSTHSGGYGGYGAGGHDDIASAPALLLRGNAAAGSAASLQCNALLLQQQQHALSGGCNVQQSAATATGGLGCCTGTLSGVFAARNLPLQDQQQLLQEDGWFGSSSGGGYFDLHTSSSGGSNPNIAATASASGGSSAASNMQQGLRLGHQGNSTASTGGGFNGRDAAAAAPASTGLLQRSGAGAGASQMRVLLQQQQHQVLLQSHCNANYANTAGDAGQGVLPAAAAAAAAADGSGAGGGSGIVRIPVGCGNAVVGVLAAHMSAVSQLSGAAVSIEAPGDELMVWATGRPDQVAMARAIIQVMLEKSQKEAAAAAAAGGAC